MSSNEIHGKKAKPLTQHDKLKRDLTTFVRTHSPTIEWSEIWEQDLPKKWKIAQDLLILPANCFSLSHWHQLESQTGQFWSALATYFRVNRIAQENRVKTDDFRSPNLTLLFGNDPLVVVTNNGVLYSYDITKCMFSWGNITEKLRIADFDCSNEVVVDLFAGIGYFTLVYLVHAKAKRVIACEWNPASAQALRNNLLLNKCQERCQVLEGDNRQICPKNCADRVNLGLIPSSELSWKTACEALRLETGGFLHIHGNVDIKTSMAEKQKPKPDWLEWAEYARTQIETILNERDVDVKWLTSVSHVEYVKSYGPRVDHLVLDVECKPGKI